MKWMQDAPEGGVSVLIGITLVGLGCIVSLYDQNWRWLLTTSVFSVLFVGWTYGVAYIYHSRGRPRPVWECPSCRYDRRGLAHGTACPECGRKD